MRFSGDGMHWTAWEAMAPTKAYMLPGPNGYNTVRVQYRDAVGNVSDRFNDYILLNSKLAIGAQDLYCIYFRVVDVEYSEKQPTVPLVTNAQDTACPESPFEGPGDVDHRATAQAFLVLPVFERGMWGVN
jgi:hypothetical protein